jgi:phage FluMu gp28-like protein
VGEKPKPTMVRSKLDEVRKALSTLPQGEAADARSQPYSLKGFRGVHVVDDARGFQELDERYKQAIAEMEGNRRGRSS